MLPNSKLGTASIGLIITLMVRLQIKSALFTVYEEPVRQQCLNRKCSHLMKKN